jgi:hypothetical protein
MLLHREAQVVVAIYCTVQILLLRGTVALVLGGLELIELFPISSFSAETHLVLPLLRQLGISVAARDLHAILIQGAVLYGWNLNCLPRMRSVGGRSS